MTTTNTIRVTCKAVTIGTPSIRTFAVIAISANPPGVKPNQIVASGSSLYSAMILPNIATINKLPKVNISVASKNLGAALKKAGLYRSPSDQPIRSWPILTTSHGMDVATTPVKVKSIEINSGPSTQAFGRSRF